MKKNNKRLKIRRYWTIFLEMINNLPHLFNLNDINNYLKKHNIKIDRTTVYRNIKKLINKKIIVEVENYRGNLFYELKGEENHHHHFICQNCHNSFSFYDKEIENNIASLAKRLKNKIKISILNHNILLTGFCIHCQK